MRSLPPQRGDGEKIFLRNEWACAEFAQPPEVCWTGGKALY